MHTVSLTLNGNHVEGQSEARLTLADFLRDQIGFTGTKLGCEHGVCGACTVLVEGEAVRSCLILAVQAIGTHVMTVEGLAAGGALSKLQEAFKANHALQCGFCTPGFLMSVHALLRDNPTPTDDEIRTGLAGNLCRCTGYSGIVAAVRELAGAVEVVRD